MKAYQPYVEHLNALADSVLAPMSHEEFSSFDRQELRMALDGGAPTALRALVDLEDRRKSGAFFTSSALAELAWQPLSSTLDSRSVIVDPACGAGSLLIPGLRSLLDLVEVDNACRQVRGRDLVESFVAAAQIRLALTIIERQLALGRTPDVSACDFPGIQVGDGFSEMRSLLDGATHAVLNPPYNPINAPADCNWAVGKINHAALFSYKTFSCMPPGSQIVAILPDVLRSGPRYAQWRAQVQQIVEVNQIIPWGIFDEQTDVHVFILHATKKSDASMRDVPSIQIGISSGREGTFDSGVINSPTISSHFEISVGAVVPHRHDEIGPMRPFATARELPVWQAVTELSTTRRFAGRCETPPFVAIRRTSRPGQSPRARATLINGEAKVAVDNHLIIAQPFDGSDKKCLELLQLLQDPLTTAWLDGRYRCRHLPVEAIANLPWLIGIRSNNV